jgi:hypothetical protein
MRPPPGFTSAQNFFTSAAHASRSAAVGPWAKAGHIDTTNIDSIMAYRSINRTSMVENEWTAFQPRPVVIAYSSGIVQGRHAISIALGWLAIDIRRPWISQRGGD